MNILPVVLTAALTVGAPPDATIQADPEAEPSVRSVCCQDQMDRGHALLVEGRWREARKTYQKAAHEKLLAGEFPGYALWQVAEIDNGRGKRLRAARQLDQVARHAAAFGRPTMQVRALTEAVDIYHKIGRNDLAFERYQRVEALLASPDVGEDVRQLAASRFQNRVGVRIGS